MNIIGVDLGGTKLRTGVVEVDDEGRLGEVQSWQEQGTPPCWEELVKILHAYREEREEGGIEIDGLGIALAGVIENRAKVIKSPAIPWLDGRDVAEELGEELNLKVVVSNDLEAAAKGEMAGGVLDGVRWAIFDTISTGWGGVLVLNGEVVPGEPGHVNLGFDLPYVCGCGNRGCLEALYSGSAMERRILHRLREEGVLSPSSLKVWDYFYKALETGDRWAVSLLEEWAEGVGRAWANVLNRISRIEVIAYMGETAEHLIPRAEERIRAVMRRICMFPWHKDLPILKAQKPHRAIHGAVIIWREETQRV